MKRNHYKGLPWFENFRNYCYTWWLSFFGFFGASCLSFYVCEKSIKLFSHSNISDFSKICACFLSAVGEFNLLRTQEAIKMNRLQREHHSLITLLMSTSVTSKHCLAMKGHKPIRLGASALWVCPVIKPLLCMEDRLDVYCVLSRDFCIKYKVICMALGAMDGPENWKVQRHQHLVQQVHMRSFYK